MQQAIIFHLTNLLFRVLLLSKNKPKNLAAQVHGRAALIAATGSMSPAITANDIIVYVPTKVADVNVGDIVVVEYQLDDNQPWKRSLFTHRVYSKVSHFIVTKGDHNKDPDTWTNSDSNLKGVVVYIIDGQTGETKYQRT